MDEFHILVMIYLGVHHGANCLTFLSFTFLVYKMTTIKPSSALLEILSEVNLTSQEVFSLLFSFLALLKHDLASIGAIQ